MLVNLLVCFLNIYNLPCALQCLKLFFRFWSVKRERFLLFVPMRYCVPTRTFLGVLDRSTLQPDQTWTLHDHSWTFRAILDRLWPFKYQTKLRNCHGTVMNTVRYGERQETLDGLKTFTKSRSRLRFSLKNAIITVKLSKNKFYTKRDNRVDLLSMEHERERTMNAVLEKVFLHRSSCVWVFLSILWLDIFFCVYERFHHFYSLFIEYR